MVVNSVGIGKPITGLIPMSPNLLFPMFADE